MTTTNTPAGKARYSFRYYQGVRYVAPWRPAPSTFARCLACGRAWDDDKPTGMTPTPSGRCPFEGFRGHSTQPAWDERSLVDAHRTAEQVAATFFECRKCGARREVGGQACNCCSSVRLVTESDFERARRLTR